MSWQKHWGSIYNYLSHRNELWDYFLHNHVFNVTKFDVKVLNEPPQTNSPHERNSNVILFISYFL